MGGWQDGQNEGGAQAGEGQAATARPRGSTRLPVLERNDELDKEEEEGLRGEQGQRFPRLE